MGKSAVPETPPQLRRSLRRNRFHTPPSAPSSNPPTLILFIGSIKSDFNTGGFTFRIGQLSTIDFHSTHVQVNYAVYQVVRMNGVISKVVQRMDWAGLKSRLGLDGVENLKSPVPIVDSAITDSDKEFGKDVIHHAYLWPRISKIPPPTRRSHNRDRYFQFRDLENAFSGRASLLLVKFFGGV